jgi:hypothetical protein
LVQRVMASCGGVEKLASTHGILFEIDALDTLAAGGDFEVSPYNKSVAGKNRVWNWQKVPYPKKAVKQLTSPDDDEIAYQLASADASQFYAYPLDSSWAVVDAFTSTVWYQMTRSQEKEFEVKKVSKMLEKLNTIVEVCYVVPEDVASRFRLGSFKESDLVRKVGVKVMKMPLRKKPSLKVWNSVRPMRLNLRV